jgi:hypothetical protein
VINIARQRGDEVACGRGRDGGKTKKIKKREILARACGAQR